MYNYLFKVLNICFFSLLLNSYTVKSEHRVESYSNVTESFNTILLTSYAAKSSQNITKDYVAESEGHSNIVESVKSFNKTDVNDYSETTDEEEEEEEENYSCNHKSFVDKVKSLHEKGKNNTVRKHVKNINESIELLKSARNAFGSLLLFDERERLKFLEFLSDVDLGLSPECLASYIRINSALSERQLWAVKFVDSIARFPPPGFAEGVLGDFGEYDECLDVISPMIDRKTPVIKGQYCLMNIILPFPKEQSYREEENFEPQLNMGFKFGNDLNLPKYSAKNIMQMLNLVNGTIYRSGICIPSNCKPFEVENMLNKIIQPIAKLPVEVDPNCHIKDEVTELENFQLVSITILLILAILVISSTAFEVYKNIQDKEKLPEVQKTKTSEILVSFSLIRNTQSLFIRNEKWAALDTIRLLFIIYVHIVHIYLGTILLGLVSLKKAYTLILPRFFEDSRYFMIRNSLMIDALFTLSGFLLSYGLLRKLGQNKGRFNYILFIFQHWLRFVLLAFGSILFFYLFPLSGKGPIFHYGVHYISNGCKNPINLMQIFLFVYNFHDLHTDTCNTPLWFLSSLLQFLLISPLFVILYYKKPKIGAYSIITAIIVTLFLSISPTLLFGIKPYLQVLVHGTKLLGTDIMDSIKWYHSTPNVHAISYFVGIAFGVLMRKKLTLSQLEEKLFWILSTVSIIIMYYWNNSFWKPGKAEGPLSALLWLSIGKLMFSMSFGWIYYAICTGRGGYLNQLLSWHGFQPMARLSFGIFLLHYLTLAHRIFNVKYTVAMNDTLMFRNIIIDSIINVMLAYIFYILIEKPFSNIFTVIFSRKPVRKPIENSVQIKSFGNRNIKL